MKKSILFLLFVFSAVTFAQQKKYSITWEGSQVLSVADFTIEVPAFNKEYFNYDFDKGLLFNHQWKTNVEINEASASISNIVYETVSKTELIDLDSSKIPSELNFTLKNSTARNDKYIAFECSPIIRDGNGMYKKIISFQLSYKEGNNLNKKLSRKYKATKAVSNSVLSSGEWYRFYIDTTGVFKLTKGFLKSLGVNVNTVDPRTIKVFGHGGKMIPYQNSVDYPFDVPENAIQFIGEDDGVLNDNDYILFYGQGPAGYEYFSEKSHINCYTDKTYYYINVSSGIGKRIQPFNEPVGSVDMVIDTYDDYQYHEVDDYNLISLGRRWFGDKFDIENSKEFVFDFKGLITSEPVNLEVVVATASMSPAQMKVSVNDNEVSSLDISGVRSPSLANGDNYSGRINVDSPSIKVSLDFNNLGNPSVVGYLDYISVEAKRALNFDGSQFLFKNNLVSTLSGIGQYNITNASNLLQVWDVTDIYNVSSVANSNKNTTFSFTSILGSLKSYVAVASNYLDPKIDSKTTIVNQNIKGTIFENSQGVFQDVDYIIIAPSNMFVQAERLAQINREQYGLNVKVLKLEEIYNEFSSGNQDIGAIRNMVKYVYDNASTPENRIKYLCLFGDGSYDYKDRVSGNTNIVPSWYSYNSFSLATSFVSDDFYGMMDDNEGNMSANDKLDIAVGRILADTPQRALELVNKIESYYSKQTFGSWRNNFVVISDDNDSDLKGTLQATTDEIGDLVAEEKPFVNVVKIHADAYNQESSAGGDRYPVVTSEIVSAMDNGALVVNYFGHGGEDGLAEERFFLKNDITDLRNVFKLNCFVTVTCEFTRFDNPFRETAGEFTFWNKETGAIGLITTTRQVFVNFGIRFNRELGQYLYSYSDTDIYEDYEYPSMAEALRLTKNDPAVTSNGQKSLVFFIGDPAMKLAFPKPNIRLTKINDVPIATATDTLKGLSYVKLAGEVTDVAGNLLTAYNGTLSTTIYDKEVNRKTLGNDGISDSNGVIIMDFKTLGEIIFRGQASVTNGLFEFDFVVPKDIGIPVGFGKASFYVKNEALTEDKTGASVNTIRIGGLNEDAPEDNTGPVVTLYMNDENFVTGGITNESPTLLAKLEDANGINTASGIGHDIVGVLDGDETNPVILNDYYQTEVDDYTKGTVSFPFKDLEPGLHTLTVKAWDVYNNSSISEIQFIVFDKDEGLVINNVLNYPNPFVNYTEFWFNHNSSEPLDVSIQIFTVSGKIIRTLNGQTTGGINATSSLSRDIVWDGRDDFGDKIGKGVYIYKLKVHSNLLNKTVEKIEKLVIL